MDGFPAFWLEPLQDVVPRATPWQYCVTLFSHGLPPAPLKKLWRIEASPDGSFPVHCEPQYTT